MRSNVQLREDIDIKSSKYIYFYFDSNSHYRGKELVRAQFREKELIKYIYNVIQKQRENGRRYDYLAPADENS